MSKIFNFQKFVFGKFPANHADFAHFAQNPVNHAKFAPFVDPLYINAFRFLTIDRELSEIPANRPDFRHFTHSSCELCEIRAIRTHGQ